MDHKCYARTYAHKAIYGLTCMPIILALCQVGLMRGGASLLDVPRLIYLGGLIWWKQAIGWTCMVVGALRYGPPSWRALRHGMCAIELKGDILVLPGIEIQASDVASIAAVSTLTRKGIVIQTIGGKSHYVCTILTDLNRPSLLAKRVRADVKTLVEA